MTDTETTAFERRVYYLTVLKRRACNTPCQHHTERYQGRSGGRRSKGKAWVRAFIVVFMGKEWVRQDRSAEQV